MSGRLVLVPGFTQTAASWSAVVAALPLRLDVAALDVPDAPDFPHTAALLAAAGGRGTWAGYSMGGRLALRLALDQPHLVDALVLVSASPGIRDATERAERAAADDRLAADLERDGVDPFLERWLAQPMFATVPRDAPGLAERHTLAAGFLAHCLRVLGTGVMEPLWDRLPELEMPVTIVTGTLDAKFDATGDEMAARIPHATRVRVEGGHALPLEAPRELAAVLRDAVVAPGA